MGYVYLLSNPSMPGLVKLGCTDRPPAERISELSAATGVPTPFTLELSVFVPDHLETESQLHQALSSYRVNDSREFFRIPVAKAKTFLYDKQIEAMLSAFESWDDESLMKLVDSIFWKHPNVRKAF